MKKKLVFMLFLLIGSFSFSACYDSVEVDDQTYVIAMGFDVGKTDPLKMTLQYANANTLSPNGSGGNTNAGTVFNVSAEATTIATGINQANAYIGKDIDLSHAVLLVFSEEYAKKGISEYLRGATRNRDFRPTMNVAICRGSAEEYLSSISPIQETDPSKYYQLLFSKYSTTGYSVNSNIFNFYNAMGSNDMQPIANIVGVNKYDSSKQFSDKSSTYREKGHIIPLEGDYIAGDIPKIGDEKAELMGLGVFNGDRLVGILDGEAAMDYHMITGELTRATLTIPDPKVPGKLVILTIKQSRAPISKVDITSSSPKINTKIQLEGDITIIQSDYNYEAVENLPIIESAVETHLKKDIEALVSKTINVYKSDIFGFGKEVKKKFLTIDEWDGYNWLSKYEDSTFTLDIDMKIRRPGLKLRTSPVLYSDKKEKSQ